MNVFERILWDVATFEVNDIAISGLARSVTVVGTVNVYGGKRPRPTGYVVSPKVTLVMGH